MTSNNKVAKGSTASSGRGPQKQPGYVYDPKDNDTALKEKGRRAVFKHVLESPFNYKWPTLSEADNQDIMELLCSLLAPIGTHRRAVTQARHECARERKAARQKAKALAKLAKEKEASAPSAADATQISAAGATPAPQTALPQTLAEREAAQKLLKKQKKKDVRNTTAGSPSSRPLPDVPFDSLKAATAPDTVPPPSIMKSIMLGLNTISTQLTRASTISPSQTGTSDPVNLRLIFLCTGDMPSVNLYAHIPTLTYLAGGDIRLCPLAKGAQARLADALGMKSCGALGIIKNSPEFDAFCTLVASKVEAPVIPWLPPPPIAKPDEAPASAPPPTTIVPAAPTAATTEKGIYLPTQIKTFRTTAPLRGRGKGRGGDQSAQRGGKGNQAGHRGDKGSQGATSKGDSVTTAPEKQGKSTDDDVQKSDGQGKAQGKAQGTGKQQKQQKNQGGKKEGTVGGEGTDGKRQGGGGKRKEPPTSERERSEVSGKKARQGESVMAIEPEDKMQV
ncbi:uncharacterized protein EV422DRAFT_521973 [Fimicolochytrium jonesii]|uniref:uncharacterized protein n=1 Tax=Fimicolochytrium jonesii TaxID=1396493 RepID=UPI0022FE7685|nr:uncharacterized protein EV422DRAFT_521973 [Fimicolochytrium jonesii]KAI8823685.1 hypothetical protein EV422DRAFT_521973 [Fimicolochytrium jonesii]